MIIYQLHVREILNSSVKNRQMKFNMDQNKAGMIHKPIERRCLKAPSIFVYIYLYIYTTPHLTRKNLIYFHIFPHDRYMLIISY
jgi:hypothetical protein